MFFLGGGKTDQEKLTVDMIYSLHRFGCMFKECFLFQFYKLNTVGREEFITDKKRYLLFRVMYSSNLLKIVHGIRLNRYWDL